MKKLSVLPPSDYYAGLIMASTAKLKARQKLLGARESLIMQYFLIYMLSSIFLLTQALPVSQAASAQPEVNFKIYSSEPHTSGDSLDINKDKDRLDNPAASSAQSANQNSASKNLENLESSRSNAELNPKIDTSVKDVRSPEGAATGKVLQGYIRVVPSGTKIPIIMDTAVDSDTSQEGDEFAARTAEDLNIDGSTVVPAGSVIKGRIAQLNAPRRLNRSGSVALKFDTVTTPDSRQIPIVCNLVARGGVVHARRGFKDIAIDTGTFALPTAIGLGIGVLAGGSKGSGSGSKKSNNRGSYALIGAGIGAAVGVAVLLAKKGKKVDVRPGDELKVELAEDLRMPM